MNEQLQVKLVEILSGIQSATKAAGDFAMEQLPDIAQQYVMYGRVSSLLFIALWLITTGLLVYLNFIFFRWMKKEDEWEAAPLAVFSFGGALGSAILLVLSLQSAALVWFAPKVWLLKALASLIK